MDTKVYQSDSSERVASDVRVETYCSQRAFSLGSFFMRSSIARDSRYSAASASIVQFAFSPFFSMMALMIDRSTRKNSLRGFTLFICINAKDLILTMVMISGTLRFVQESRSGNAAQKLLAMITTTCTVTRNGQGKMEIPMDELVVGDIVHLCAGDMIPADVRILEAKDLFVSQSALTGESEPVEKTGMISACKESITDYGNIAFMGSNVISGSATAVTVSVGDRTLFGSMASGVAEEAVQTSFTKGVNAVSWVLIRFMLVMVPVVYDELENALDALVWNHPVSGSGSGILGCHGGSCADCGGDESGILAAEAHAVKSF